MKIYKARPCGQYPEAYVQVWSNTGKSQLLSQLKFYCKTNTFATFALPTKHPICPSPPPLFPPMKTHYMYLNSTTVPQEN